MVALTTPSLGNGLVPVVGFTHRYAIDDNKMSHTCITVYPLLPFQPRYAHGLGSLQFPNGASPVVSRMYIYTGNSLDDTRYLFCPVSASPGLGYSGVYIVFQYRVMVYW